MVRVRPKIIYMGSPPFAGELLQFIIEQELADVRAVWTVPRRVRSPHRSRNSETTHLETTAVGKIAQALRLPLYEPENLDEEALTKLEQTAVDLAFVVAYGKILPKQFLAIPKYGMFNLHFSLLPRHRGASPLTEAILQGDHETGITIQKISPRLDAGPIVLQKTFSNINLDYASVLSQSLKQARIAFKSFFKYWEHSPVKLPLKEQAEAQATYCYKIRTAHTLVAARETAQSLSRKMLAFYGWKGVCFRFRGAQYFIEAIKWVSAKTFYQTPEVKADTIFAQQLMALPSDSPHLLRTVDRRLLFWFNAWDDLIELLALKKTGKRQISARDFINGQQAAFPLKLDVSNADEP